VEQCCSAEDLQTGNPRCEYWTQQEPPLGAVNGREGLMYELIPHRTFRRRRAFAEGQRRDLAAHLVCLCASNKPAREGKLPKTLDVLKSVKGALVELQLIHTESKPEEYGTCFLRSTPAR
jgi:hypothetical protein